jgi:isoquinoline 1-oxidoreductase subunit beta
MAKHDRFSEPRSRWHPTRRLVLQSVLGTGGMWVLGVPLRARASDAKPDSASAPPVAAYVRIRPNNQVTLVIPSSEMGQGVSTALAMIMAEELDLDWSAVAVEFAPNAPDYINPIAGEQETGGSNSVQAFWAHLAGIGAAAREMLVTAAATRWSVAADEITTRDSQVLHARSGRTASYGSLASEAAQIPVPMHPTPKPRARYSLVGRPTRRLDAASSTDGSAVYGIDVQVPGLLVAAIVLPPVYGAPLVSFDERVAQSRPGVLAVHRFSAGVAALSTSFWRSKQARDALAATATWGATAMDGLDSATVRLQMQASLQKPGASAEPVGDARAALAQAATVVEAVYELPFLAHACMEPMNATAWVRRDAVEIWAPTQVQQASAAMAAKLTGVSVDRVAVHTTRLGGGFGRRYATDFVQYALELSMAAGGPVKVIFTREDDMRSHHYRPAHCTRLRGGLDGDGRLVALHCRTASASMFGAIGWKLDARGVDAGAVEGFIENMYDVPHHLVEWVRHEAGPRVWFWRSTGHSPNAFAQECFIDELALASGTDPAAFRLSHLANKPRHRLVLQTALDKARWGSALPAGHARGLAMHDYRGTIVAMVAEVFVEKSAVRVKQIVGALDAGRYVNPLTVSAQVEGGIVSGLAQALRSQISFARGRVVQSNFDTYPQPRMSDMPAIDIALIESGADPTGVGEVAVPPVAPAIANAVFALTGKRLRALPLSLSD